MCAGAPMVFLVCGSQLHASGSSGTGAACQRRRWRPRRRVVAAWAAPEPLGRPGPAAHNSPTRGLRQHRRRRPLRPPPPTHQEHLQCPPAATITYRRLISHRCLALCFSLSFANCQAGLEPSFKARLKCPKSELALQPVEQALKRRQPLKPTSSWFWDQ